MGAKILLPVKAHILKYLVQTYGHNLEVSSRGYAPFLILSLLEKHKKLDPAIVRPSQKLIDNKYYFGYPVYIGDSELNSKGAYISTYNIKRFNDCMDDLFREDMYRFCNHHKSIDNIVDYDILRFREMYNISEDELPFDNLKRWYYRERIRISNRRNWKPLQEPQLIITY